VRFDRPGEPSRELTFDNMEGRVKDLYGRKMAVWGGTVLTIYPPGQEARP